MEYFKKANGTIIKVTPNHDINSLKERFTECDAKGNEIKAEKPKKEAKKASKKDKKENK
tara:strand:+ start:225 stop:401 length:177 start_codon:yes stop_codon:yes gene_type:complete